MQRIDTKRACEHEAVFGASGSGKSYYVKQIVKGWKRALIWDPDDEYGEAPGVQLARSPSQVLELMKRKAVRIRYVPATIDRKLLEKCFDFISLAAFIWGNCLYVGEEIADVTTPSKAAGGWGVVLRRGRKRGVKVVGVSQRPAECDKTLFTQARHIRTGRLDGEGDMQRLATTLRVPLAWVQQLGPLEFLTVDRTTGQLKAGIKGKATVIRKDWQSEIVTKVTE
ncbi:helicase HerA domain-containing protein [Vibrio fluvialis]|uniref:helicase HerA domain-containing protein n=1 Tax=Vibrio fluvialis TaxID=676 RepID=UPI001F2C70D4|nr:DUF87 domain-containing protein [Vibrio fluvialis]MCE7642028.1 DUF87 domain-containing protein [Vibrio fluvialis]